MQRDVSASRFHLFKVTLHACLIRYKATSVVLAWNNARVPHQIDSVLAVLAKKKRSKLHCVLPGRYTFLHAS